MSFAVVVSDIAPLYTKPEPLCELADEALYGMVLEVLAREAAGEGETDVPLPGATPEEVPLGRRTCALCAADNDGSRETCWNCGTSLRRVR